MPLVLVLGLVALVTGGILVASQVQQKRGRIIQLLDATKTAASLLLASSPGKQPSDVLAAVLASGLDLASFPPSTPLDANLFKVTQPDGTVLGIIKANPGELAAAGVSAMPGSDSWIVLLASPVQGNPAVPGFVTLEAIPGFSA